MFIIYFSTEAFVYVCVSVYLHGDCVCEHRHTLHGLICTAATASFHRHAGWNKEMVDLLWKLPPNLHQGVPGLAPAP